MKKFSLICLVLLLGVFTSAFSQKSKDLVGIWQLCNNGTQVKSGTALVPCYIWKVIDKNGKFCQFWVSNEDRVCTVMHDGKYKIKKNDTYIEYIKRHAFDQSIVDTKTVINYHFLNEDTVIFTFKLANREKQYQEVWARVKMPEIFKK